MDKRFFNTNTNTLSVQCSMQAF